MKKALTLLLTAAMLLTMLSVFAVTSVSAEETAAPARTPLKVTFQSGTSNAHSTGTTTTWEKIFDTTNSERLYARTTTDIEVIGKFETPTAITSFVLRSHFYRRRLDGITVMFSTDGANWVKGYTVQENKNNPTAGVADVEIATPGDNTLYSYVKIYKSVKMDDATNIYGDKTGKYIEVDVQHVAFYNEASKTDQLIEASLHQVTAKDGLSNADKFFTFSNTALCKTTHASGATPTNPDPLIEGKLPHPTVLTDVYVKFDGARMNGTIIKASVDGVNWTDIVAISGIWSNCNNTASAKIAHFHVTDTTAYNYVQVYRNHALWGGSWQAYSIGFVGEEQNVSNSVKYQTKVDGDAWALRLISTIDTLDCDAVGFEITATAAELTEAKAWDRNTDIVYTSITETVNGKDEIRDAAYCGGNYIYTAAITGISIADYSAITFTVKPYVLIDGAKVYGATQTIVLNDGVAA